jgi:CheY-like chemotaxis protein
MINILFVDDDADVLLALSRSLRKDAQRWHMVFACGPKEALAHLESQPFDAVVTDLEMAGLSGIELLKRVRDVTPLAKRIVLSGNALRRTFDEAVSVADEIMTKPTPVVSLREVLERCLAA